jgi:hypothetical protein
MDLDQAPPTGTVTVVTLPLTVRTWRSSSIL